MAEQNELEELDQQMSEKPEKTTGRKKRGFGVAWLAGPIILLTAGWVAPMIIANTDLREPVLVRLIPGFDQQLKIKYASLDWMSPVVMHEVTVSDANNEPIATVSEMRTERTLFQLVFQSGDLGTIELTSPVLKVKLRENGSNVEDLLNPILAAQDPEAESSQLKLVVKEATLELYDPADQLVNTTVVEQLTLQQTPSKLEMELQGTVNEASIHVAGEFEPTFESGSVRWKTERLDLASWKPLLSRMQPGARLSGFVTAEQTCLWDQSTTLPSVALSGPMQVDQLELLLPDQMGGDAFQLDELKTGGAFHVSSQQLRFENATFDSALGHFRMQGEVNLAEVQSQQNWQQQLATLINSDLAIQGYVDLAELASLFPQALSVKEDMKIVAGQADLSLHARDLNGRRVLEARLGTTDLLAEQGGKSIAWKEPLKFDCQVHLEDEWPVVDRLRGSSEFMEFQGEGSLESAKFQLTADLQKFSAQLTQFIDPGFDTLQGSLNAQFQTQLLNGSDWNAESRLIVENFVLNWPGSPSWREERLVVDGNIQGEFIDRELRKIQTAKFIVSSGTDRLQTVLTAPVELGQPPYLFATTLQGSLANWQNRLRPLTTLEPWQLGGEINLTSQTSLSDDHVRFVDTSVDISSFVARQPGVAIQEPKLRLQTAGEYDRHTGTLSVDDMTLASSSLGVRTVDLVVKPVSGATPELSGNLALKADLNRISSWFAEHPLLKQLRLGGLAKFQLQFDRGQEIAQTVGQLTLDNFSISSSAPAPSSGSRTALNGTAAVTPSSNTIWAEEAFQVTWKTSRKAEQLDLEQLTVDSKLLKLHTYGKVSELSTVRNVELSGNVEYDLENLMRILQKSNDPAVQMTGRHQKSFVLSGPLTSWAANAPAPSMNPDGSYGIPGSVQNVSQSDGKLTGQAAFGWDTAKLYGLPVGPGELALQLDDKIVRIEPVSLQVAEGRVNLSSHIRFDQASPTLHLDPAKIMENIRLTPELCGEFLQYVAPMLSDVSQIEGHFSMDLNSAQIPLLTPAGSDITGKLQIERAEVRSGQMANQLTTMVQQVKSIISRTSLQGASPGGSTWIVMPKQESEFRVTGGRVYHKRLEFHVDDAILFTTGSVGLDNSLNLVAEIPIQEKWLGNNRLAASMKGQLLRVPISGTMKQPILDQQALAVFASQFAGSAAQNYLQEELDKQLKNLFSR
ncbi:hypothetical protein Pla110_16170 [Polystyrenella longa]|uniref:Assembly protein n=1 Tax=Polystyrenella longa TaxID=2528007 RepID=A0A518CL01_9PLAN|nr:DUF748 domain-containing protein [Polystyrenella longa]QDU79897.1 hypothetical protein Pla110_16170 [Polystyrenella longa]